MGGTLISTTQRIAEELDRERGTDKGMRDAMTGLERHMGPRVGESAYRAMAAAYVVHRSRQFANGSSAGAAFLSDAEIATAVDGLVAELDERGRAALAARRAER